MSWQLSKLCVSLLPESLDHLQALLKRCVKADLIELRLDHIGQIPFKEVRQQAGKPLIITVRLASEGGFWKGNEKSRREIFQQAANAGMDYLDIEYISAALLQDLEISPPTSLIISRHVQENNLESLMQIFWEMQQLPGNVYKLVYRAEQLEDCVLTLNLLRMAEENKIKAIIHGMGEAGSTSRLLGAVRGNLWSYVSLDTTTSTAEGQISLEMAHDIYGLNSKPENTRIVGLVGFPLAQSQGWKLHNRLIQQTKQTSQNPADKRRDFIYLNFPVPEFQDFWIRWAKYLDGLSITIPHKRNIIRELDYVAYSVEKSGVCNTAIKRNGRWWGFNTDMLAIYDLIKEYEDHFSGGALVYGTGATTRSAVAALRELNVKNIYLKGRDRAAGLEIAREFEVEFIPEKSSDKLYPELIIQTTPVGMIPHTEVVPPLANHLASAKVVFDVVFNPPVTRFLQQARTAGCQIISGVQMYLRQASYQFGLFSGIPVSPVEIEDVWKMWIQQ